jgi:hypothetical protein
MTCVNRIAAASLVIVGCAVVCSPAVAGQPPAVGPAAAAPAPADTPGRIEGVVTDEAGTPLAGVAVTVQGGRLAHGVTNGDGRFAIDALKPGPYIVRAQLPGYLASERVLVHVLPAEATYRPMRLVRTQPTLGDAAAPATRRLMNAGLVGAAQPAVPAGEAAGSSTVTHDDGATAWRVRHATRSVLRDVTGADPAVAESGATGSADKDVGQMPLAAELWSGLPLSAQVQFLTTSSMGTADQVLGLGPARSVAYVTVTAPAGRSATWATQAAISQGDLSSWVVGGSYAGRITASHTLDAGVTYAAQRYTGSNPAMLAAVYDGNRTVGAMFAFDEWAFSETAALTYGTRIASYGYLADSALVSPSLSLHWQFAPSTAIYGRASSEAQAPGAEEFVPAPMAGMWLPPQRTFSPLDPGGEFQAERANRLEIGLEHEWAAFTVTARGFREDVGNQIVTVFGVGPAPAPPSEVAHYFTGNAGDLAAYGWSVSISRPVGSRVRGSMAYSLTHGNRTGVPEDATVLAFLAPSVLRTMPERLHDLVTVIETDIPETATRVYAACRLNTGFASSSPAEGTPAFGSRFEVQVNQRLPFLEFTNAEWEVLLALRNLFRDIETGTFYDELLVVRPPKRFVGGLTVRF